jgi:hypothetical protein
VAVAVHVEGQGGSSTVPRRPRQQRHCTQTDMVAAAMCLDGGGGAACGGSVSTLAWTAAAAQRLPPGQKP